MKVQGYLCIVQHLPEGDRVSIVKNRMCTAGDLYYSRRMALGTPQNFVDTGGDFNGRLYLMSSLNTGNTPNTAGGKTFTAGQVAAFVGPSGGKDPDSGYPRINDPDSGNPQAASLDLARTITYKFSYAAGDIVGLIRFGAIFKPGLAFPADDGAPAMCFQQAVEGVIAPAETAPVTCWWNHVFTGGDT
jgi:hypothetical protein